jgi:hypothetical protein
MNPKDIGLAKAVEVGDMTQVEMVEEILDHALYDIMIQHPRWGLDTVDLARRIINALNY